MNIKLLMRLLLIVSGIFSTKISIAAMTPAWPVVSGLQAEFKVTSSRSDVGVKIFSVEGKHIYTVECHDGGFESETIGDYNEMFQCKMFPVENPGVSIDIFRPNGQWNRTRTRAAFNVEHAFGGCVNHKYYGASRTFSARGMRIQLQIRDFKMSPSLAAVVREGAKMNYDFVLKLQIEPDEKAFNDYVGSVPEICYADYQIDKFGKLRESIFRTGDPSALEAK
jgi:hypothetical protein